MEFKKVTFEDICLKITDGAHYSPKATAEGYPMYSVKDMKYNNFDNISSKLISEKDYQKLVKQGCRPEKNDVVIAKDGSYLKHVFVISDDIEAAILSSIAILKPNLDLVNPYYLSYFLKQKSVKEHMKNGYVSGSVLPRIILKDFKKYPISLPHLKIQNKVVEILKKIDSKIDNNQRIIANLEELSQTIFKHWFIDFEFPNQSNSPYNYNRKGTSKDLPHGWKWEKLNHLFKINYGKNLPTKNLLDTGYPVYGGNGKIGYYSNYMYDDPKILISCRGAASGAIHISQEHSFITNNSIVLDEIDKEYFYYFKELFSRETFKHYTTGSAQPQITIVNIKELKFLVPPKSLVIEFNKHQKPIFDFNSKLKQENSKLKNLRDTLLPKLMSGELEIPDDVEVNMDELSI